VAAVVSRGGRPELAWDDLPAVAAPTLLIVGGDDEPVLTWNRDALDRLSCHKELVVPGATHLFEEPGPLERVAELARDWFTRHLTPAGPATSGPDGAVPRPRSSGANRPPTKARGPPPGGRPMRLPLQGSFRNTDPVPGAGDAIRDRAARLDRYRDHVAPCRVVADVPHRHRRAGNLFQARPDVTVPGDEIAVTREATDHEAAKRLAAAIKDAFDAADRLLGDHARRRRRGVKHLDGLPHARVRVVAGRDHGFPEAADGREVYFHRDSLVNAEFDAPAAGTEVAFVEEPGEKGPQASTARVVGRHGRA